MQSRSFLSQTSVLVMNPGFSIPSSLHQSEPQKVTLDSQINKGTNFPSHKDRRFVPRFSHHRSANIIIVFHKTRCYLALNNNSISGSQDQAIIWNMAEWPYHHPTSVGGNGKKSSFLKIPVYLSGNATLMVKA